MAPFSGQVRGPRRRGQPSRMHTTSCARHSSYTLQLMEQEQMHDTAPESAPQTPQPNPPVPTSPLLDRPRPQRLALVPLWVPVSAAVVVGVVALVALVLMFVMRGSNVVVTRIVGIDVGVARTRLAQDGLVLTVAEERFSALPEGTVIEQQPAPGVELGNGDEVTVVVSAGSEDFAMPDLIGAGLAYARGQLEDKGLEIRVLTEPSNQTSDTVLASTPAAGSNMRTGDIVTLTVATTGVGDSVLLPTAMQGVAITLDPAPAVAGRSDIPLEVARRLRSLLEASGATVYTTRALADTGTAVSEDARAQRAKGASVAAAVGLNVATQGATGMIVRVPATGPVALPSGALASQITSALVGSGLVATRSTETTDKVLGATGAPFSRVLLGSFSSREDVAHFSDPAWADRVARAVYRALAVTYGKKQSTP